MMGVGLLAPTDFFLKARVAPIDTGVSLNLINPNLTGWVEDDADVHPVRYLCRNDAARRQIKPAS